MEETRPSNDAHTIEDSVTSPSGDSNETLLGTEPQVDVAVASSPVRAKRSIAPILVAALFGATAGGLVSYQVASTIDDSDTGRTPRLGSARRQAPAPAGTVAKIIEDVRPSVVALFTESAPERESFFETQPSQGAGTGIVLDRNGHILTNAHVVSGTDKINVVFHDGRKLTAKVVGGDESTDLAVIKVEANDLIPAPLGDSDSLRVGDEVIAVGHALALPGGPTVTDGIVSALDRSINEQNGAVLENLIQTDAAINPGNSGGALLDRNGNVVGINTAIAGNAQNIGFAIAITPARTIVDQLLKEGKVVRPFLGVHMVDVTPEVAAQQELGVKEGALVVQVVVGSPAALAGIEPGDVIVEIEGKTVRTADEAKKLIGGKKPGDKLDILIARGNERIRVKPALTTRS